MVELIDLLKMAKTNKSLVSTFDAIDKYLKEEWLEQKLGNDISITLKAPRDNVEGEKGVSLYLMKIESAFPRDSTGSLLPLELHYLVTTWANNEEDAHRLFGELVFDAVANHADEFEVQFNPLAISDWLVFGTKPRPSFILKYTVKKPPAEALPESIVKTVKIESQVGLISEES